MGDSESAADLTDADAGLKKRPSFVQVGTREGGAAPGFYAGGLESFAYSLHMQTMFVGDFFLRHPVGVVNDQGEGIGGSWRRSGPWMPWPRLLREWIGFGSLLFGRRGLAVAVKDRAGFWVPAERVDERQ